MLGAMTPISVAVTVLFFVGDLQHFFLAYLLQNIAYAGRTGATLGAKLEAMYNFTFFGKHALRELMVSQVLFLLIGLFTCAGFSRRFTRVTWVHFLFGIFFFAITFYAVSASGNIFPHYLNFFLPVMQCILMIVFGAFVRIIQHESVSENGGSQTISQVLGVSVLGFYSIFMGFLSFLNDSSQLFSSSKWVSDDLAVFDSDAARVVLGYASPGEAMAIWGWTDLLYIQTGLIPATRYASTPYQIWEGHYRDYFRADFIKRLKDSDVPIFVDAVGPSNFAFDRRERDGHETSPELRKLVRRKYFKVGDVDGYRIYVLRNRMKAIRQALGSNEKNQIAFPTFIEEQLALQDPTGINRIVEKFHSHLEALANEKKRSEKADSSGREEQTDLALRALWRMIEENTISKQNAEVVRAMAIFEARRQQGELPRS